MSPFLNRCLLAVVLGTTSMAAHAQWGVRWSMLHYEQHTKRIGGLNWLLGVDHDPSSRTSIGLDFFLSLNLPLDGVGGVLGQGKYLGYTVDYRLTRQMVGFQYRSMYFLSDNDGVGLYLGPYVGLRVISRETVVEWAYAPTPWGGSDYISAAWTEPSTAISLVYPVGMRFGLRFPLDGIFMDLHVSAGHQIGYDKERWEGGWNGVGPLPYLEKRVLLRGFSIQAAYVVGVGW